MNTTTPDGYAVDGNGAWTVDVYDNVTFNTQYEFTSGGENWDGSAAYQVAWASGWKAYADYYLGGQYSLLTMRVVPHAEDFWFALIAEPVYALSYFLVGRGLMKLQHLPKRQVAELIFDEIFDMNDLDSRRDLSNGDQVTFSWELSEGDVVNAKVAGRSEQVTLDQLTYLGDILLTPKNAGSMNHNNHFFNVYRVNGTITYYELPGYENYDSLFSDIVTSNIADWNYETDIVL